MTRIANRFRRMIAAVALLALVVPALAACGGDEAEAATDEEYVTAICGAVAGVEERLDERFAELEAEGEDADLEDLEELFEQMFIAIGEMAETVADELEDVNPPADLREYHDTMVDGLRLLADTFRNADGLEDLDEDSLAALEGFDTDAFPEVEARLEAAAANVPECEGVFNEE